MCVISGDWTFPRVISFSVEWDFYWVKTWWIVKKQLKLLGELVDRKSFNKFDFGKLNGVK